MHFRLCIRRGEENVREKAAGRGVVAPFYNVAFVVGGGGSGSLGPIVNEAGRNDHRNGRKACRKCAGRSDLDESPYGRVAKRLSHLRTALDYEPGAKPLRPPVGRR